MKGSVFLQLAVIGFSTAFVLPNEQLSSLRHVEISARRQHEDAVPFKAEYEEGKELLTRLRTDFEEEVAKVPGKVDHFAHEFETVWDNIVDHAQSTKEQVESQIEESFTQAKDCAGRISEAIDEEAKAFHEEISNSVEAAGDHHHHKPNLTVYQLIAGSKYTTQLAKLINEYDDLVEALNGTKANYTVFAPTDYAFEKIPKHAPKPSKKLLKYILSYHVSPDFYPVRRILAARTIPTLLESDELGEKALPQRLSTNIGFKGLTVNFYSRVVAANIFGTNGVIHGVDSLILPPPRILSIIDLLPGEFSTLELGLIKTGLFDELNSTDIEHKGATFFAPSNFAFTKLGHSANAFLFSEYGLKYLKALLKYHLVPKITLYSDALYKAGESSLTTLPKGVFHIDLPTLLKDKSLSVDIARYGRFIEIKINAFARVTVGDGVARDGVIHGVSDVIIPPKKLDDGKESVWDGKSEISVEDLKERLEAFVEQDNDHSEDL